MKEEAKLVIRVQPNARKNELQGFREGQLYIKIAALPVEGKANQELVSYLSDILGIAKSRITVEKGVTGRRKLISIAGLNQERVNAIIADMDNL
ncbi:DUF167 domain-containing protein [Chloroflexota bacterium]